MSRAGHTLNIHDAFPAVFPANTDAAVRYVIPHELGGIFVTEGAHESYGLEPAVPTQSLADYQAAPSRLHVNLGLATTAELGNKTREMQQAVTYENTIAIGTSFPGPRRTMTEELINLHADEVAARRRIDPQEARETVIDKLLDSNGQFVGESINQYMVSRLHRQVIPDVSRLVASWSFRDTEDRRHRSNRNLTIFTGAVNVASLAITASLHSANLPEIGIMLGAVDGFTGTAIFNAVRQLRNAKQSGRLEAVTNRLGNNVAAHVGENLLAAFKP